VPQIAARASHHVRVTKAVRGGRARAAVEALAGEARVSEIARMLGGETRVAVRHARELLAVARRARG
jgi:DNA repair protein RecN (Recombination protein N)